MKTLIFKKDFAPEDYKRIETAIYKYFKKLYKSYLNGVCFNSFRQLDDIIGTAYTSTGIYAIYGVCNGVNIYLDANESYNLQMFCIDINNNVYAEYWHNETEEPIYIRIN